MIKDIVLSIVFVIILVTAFIVSGTVIIQKKKSWENGSAANDNSSKSSSANDPRITDPQQYFLSPWGWIVRTESGVVTPVATMTFTPPETAEVTISGKTITFILGNAADDTTIIRSGQQTLPTAETLSSSELSKYSFVRQGNIDPKCVYSYIPPAGPTILGVGRRSQISTYHVVPYVPKCIEPNVISGQRIIRLCMGTILFGNKYQAIPQCLDHNSIRRDAGYTESYTDSYTDDCKGVDFCNTDVNLSILKFQPQPGESSQVDKYMTVVTSTDINNPNFLFALLLHDPIDFTITGGTNGPAQLFEVERFNQNGIASVNGSNYRIKNQNNPKYVMTVDDNGLSSTLVMILQTDAVNAGINWRYFPTVNVQNKSVFNNGPSVNSPASTLIDPQKFKVSMTVFHNAIRTVGVGAGPNSAKAIIDAYETLVSQNKIYVNSADGSEQGIIEIIEIIRTAINVVQGITALVDGSTPGLADVPFNSMYSAFSYLFNTYYTAVNITSPQTRLSFRDFMNTHLEDIIGITIADQNQSNSIIHDSVTNNLIPAIDDIITVHSDPRYTALRDVLADIRDISTSLAPLQYLKTVVSKIPQYSSTVSPDFTVNWLLIRNALVAAGNLITNDKTLYAFSPTQIEAFKSNILQLIYQFQGHVEVLTTIPQGLFFCEKMTSIPLIPQLIINWFNTNSTTTPVYRVYRSSDIYYSIEKVVVRNLTYFGYDNNSAHIDILKSSLEIENILGINSTIDSSII